jgi:VanZ family protein
MSFNFKELRGFIEAVRSVNARRRGRLVASGSNSKEVIIRLRAPVLTLVLAATAIPIELRTPHAAALSSRIYPFDLIANVLGYVPVGMVLSDSGLIRAGLIATVMTLLAEGSQFAMMHRSPSTVDVASNLVGALVGWHVSAYWRADCQKLTIGRTHARIAAILGIALSVVGHWTSGPPTNLRGAEIAAEIAGGLEGHWPMDGAGTTMTDTSGHGQDGRLVGGARQVDGVMRGAVALDGRSAYVDVGLRTAFRLVGSTTITAWIHPSEFPIDDAAIVSTHDGLGYQLDTTVDRGLRTIGFKLANACGNVMARYGGTTSGAFMMLPLPR